MALTLEELTAAVKRAQANDSEAVNQVLEACQPLIRGMTRRYNAPPDLIEDLKSAGAVGVLLAIKRYDAALGAFPPYARKWIHSQMGKAFAAEKRAAKSPAGGGYLARLDDVSSDDSVPLVELVTDSMAPTPVDLVGRREEASLIVRCAQSLLTDIQGNPTQFRFTASSDMRFLGDVLERHVLSEDHPLQSTADQYQVTREAVRQCASKLRGLLTKRLGRLFETT